MSHYAPYIISAYTITCVVLIGHVYIARSTFKQRLRQLR